MGPTGRFPAGLSDIETTRKIVGFPVLKAYTPGVHGLWEIPVGFGVLPHYGNGREMSWKNMQQSVKSIVRCRVILSVRPVSRQLVDIPISHDVSGLVWQSNTAPGF